MQLSLFGIETDAEEKLHRTFISDLKRGSGFVDGKIRILKILHKNLPKSEAISLLKNEYGIGGRSTIASGGYRQRHDSKGIKIQLKTGEEKLYTWSQVYDAIFNLIETGQYIRGSE